MKIDRALEIAARARIKRPKKQRHQAAAAQLEKTTSSLPDEGASSDGQPTTSMPAVRDARGHYLKGWAGGPGRPKGSRNRLTEAFVDDLLAEWQKHGRKAIRRLCEQSPIVYVRIR